MSTRLRRAPSLDALSSTNLAARSTKSRSSAKTEKYSSDEYSGRDSSEERSGRARRRRSKKTGRERSVSATRPRVGIGGTGIEDKDFGKSSGRDRPSSARTDTKPVIMRDRPQTARPSDDRRSSISSIQIGANNKLTSSNRLSGSVNYTAAAQFDVRPSGSSGISGNTIERGRSVTRGARPYLQRSQSEVTLTPRTQLQGEDGADRFRQSLKLAAMKLQSTNHRRVNAPSNPTTPTTPGTPFGGGHPLAMFSGSPQMAVKRTEVPPSPDAIRCSKTMSKLQQVLTDREKQPRPTSMVAMSDAESGTDSRPPKANGTPDRARKAPTLAKLKMHSSSVEREYQPRTEPSQAPKKVENSQPVIHATVAKPEVSKNDLERLEDGFNSQIQKILARLDKVEGENKILAKENNFLKKEVEDVNATLKDEYERFSKEIKSLNSTVRTQNGTIEDLQARIAVLESSQFAEKESISPMTVAPRKKTLDEICDIDELEKMLDEESDYEARKAIRSRLRSLHKAKTAEIENRQKAKTQLPLNIPTTDDEIVVEKRTRGRARVQRSMSSVASLQSSNSTNSERLAEKKNDLGRVSRTPSQASLREDDFGAAESSSSPSPSESSIAARARPQTAQPKSSSSLGASPKTTSRPSTAKPATMSQAVETAEIVSKSSSSGKSKLYTDSGRSMTVGAISDLSSSSSSKSMSKKESAIADLKRRTDQRKAELTRIQSMPNGGTSGAAAARKKFMSRLGEDNPENRKLRRSNTISGGGPTGVKSLLLKWCQVRCKDYPVEVNNYSSSWADGSAFCALTHSFFPDAFKWEDVILNTDNNDERRKNFSLAFDTALEKADAEPLIEVEDMIFMGNRPDAKCIFCYLQSLYNKLRKFEQPIEKKDLDV